MMTMKKKDQNYTSMSEHSYFYSQFCPRAVLRRMVAAIVLPWLTEFSGVVLSCFTLSRQTSLTEVPSMQPEDSPIPLFEAIVHSRSWSWKLVNRCCKARSIRVSEMNLCKIQNTQEIKENAFNRTKQDKTCKFAQNRAKSANLHVFHVLSCFV